MAPKRQHVALLLILALAASLRLTALDWDGYQHYHPDERYISWAATTIEAPSQWTTAFSAHRSTFNPFYWPAGAASAGIVVPQDAQRSFAYGHLPLYLGVLATRLAERIGPLAAPWLPAHWALTRDLLNGGDFVEFQHLTAVSRALTAFFDLGTVFLVFLLGRRLYGAATGLLAAAFLAVNVMHIQLARFFAVDPYLTFFVVAALLGVVRILNAESVKQLVLTVAFAATAIGLAVGSKFSAILLLLPLAVALWLHHDMAAARRRKAFLGATLLVGFVFAVTNPFALLDWTCSVVTPAVQLGPLQLPAINWGSCYLDNVARQGAMVRGADSFDFTRQYLATAPYIYPLLMQVRWGMGYLLGVVAIGGFAWAVGRAGRLMLQDSRRPGDWTRLPAERRAEIVVLAWAVPYFVVTGSFFVKFMRYMQPLTPFLMIFGAALLLKQLARGQRRVVASVVLGGTLLYAAAFLAMYRDEHPWIQASRWMHQNGERGALVVVERWDEPLPSSMSIDGAHYSRNNFEFAEVNWLGGTGGRDDDAKLRRNLERIAQADYLTISSNRGYGVASRLDTLYPLSSQYYQLLFAGDLGFQAVTATGRQPRIAQLAVTPDRFGDTGLALPAVVAEYLAVHVDFVLAKADESFTVYDQPLAIIFYNEERLSAEEMIRRFHIP